MDNEKTKGQLLQGKLEYKPESAWKKSADDFRKAAFEFCEGYKDFLDKGKTEREIAAEIEKKAVKAGFISIDKVISENKRIVPGMKLYRIIRGKSAILSVTGSAPLEKGANMVGAHIDSPRIDIKQNPLYEDAEMALLDTPLALHGVIVKGDGGVLEIKIGEDDSDPVFVITDLLPHLAAEQMQKKMSEAITGEGLNVLFGSIPYDDEKVKEKVKLNILNLLNEKYGIVEEDFISAELEIVPAFKARDVGLDRSMVGAYGQDDRICAYAALKAILEIENVERTAICVLSDKEEIGSVGNTGAESNILENYVADLCACGAGFDNYNDIMAKRCLGNSKMLSADVNAAVDPNYENVHEKKNASFMGKGIVLTKYTGARGKSGASDASAEFVGEIRRLFNKNGIAWQTGELGKVDQGGGGTIAKYVANLGADVLDCGVALLSMHSPFEIASKIDVYINYNAYKIFYKEG